MEENTLFKFDTLAERMEYYKGVYNYILPKRGYVIVHIDGRAFSKNVKKKFDLPFDKMFCNIMDKTAQYVAKNVSGCKVAYTQSDEISLLLTDFDKENTEPFFGNRLCKLQSIIASLATAEFNRLMMLYYINKYFTTDYNKVLANWNNFQFDCKVFSVPTYNDACAWFIYRHNDCIRNSKQQAAQTYIPNKILLNKTTDQQVELLKEMCNIDWEKYDDRYKYGSIYYRFDGDWGYLPLTNNINEFIKTIVPIKNENAEN